MTEQIRGRIDRARLINHDRAMKNDDRLAALVAETDEDLRWEVLRDFVVNETAAARSVATHAIASDDARTREIAADILGSRWRSMAPWRLGSPMH